MPSRERRFYEVRGDLQGQLQGLLDMPAVDILALAIVRSVLEASNSAGSWEQVKTLLGRLHNMLVWAKPAYDGPRFFNTSKFCGDIEEIQNWFERQNK
jgi:hypothetical protein